MAKIILGIAGEMGAGKGAVTKHIIQNYGASSYKFSQAFRDILDRLHLPQSRENISELSTILRKSFGEEILAKGMYRDVHDDAHDVVVIDGIRRSEDIVYIKEIPEFKMVYIEANMGTRYERLCKRGENAGDSTKSFEQFQKDSELNPEVEIRDLKNYADHVIDNDGEYAELYKQVDEIIKQYISKE